jgi:hypothetical protein
MTSIPTIAWVDVSTRRLLDAHARAQGVCVEEMAAELICDRLRELGVKPPPTLPAQLPPIGLLPDGNGAMRCPVQAAPTTDSFVLTMAEDPKRKRVKSSRA